MIRATSPAQQRAWEAAEAAPAETVAPGVVAYGVPMPTPWNPSSLGYLLLDREGGVHVVDPGLPGAAARAALDAALASAGRSEADVRSIVVTHLHPDHLGAAPELHAATGAPVRMHAREAEALHADPGAGLDGDLLTAWGVPEARWSELTALSIELGSPELRAVVGEDVLVEGDALPGTGWRVLEVPGHTAGSLALHEPELGLVLTGDALLPTVFAGIGLGGGHLGHPVDEHLASLERLAGLGDLEVLPGHGFRFTGLAHRADETRAHHERRTREVASARAEEPDASIWRIATRLTWTSGFDALAGFALASALRQTAMHAERAAR